MKYSSTQVYGLFIVSSITNLFHLFNMIFFKICNTLYFQFLHVVIHLTFLECFVLRILHVSYMIDNIGFSFLFCFFFSSQRCGVFSPLNFKSLIDSLLLSNLYLFSKLICIFTLKIVFIFFLIPIASFLLY